MSRTLTTDELRLVYAELKRQGLSRYDYDELVRIDSQGRLMMTTDVVDASRAACQAIRDTFKQLASFLIVALNRKISGDNLQSTTNGKQCGPYDWALYLEIDDNVDHPNMFLDGYDVVSLHIPEIDDILAIAKSNGVDINKNNVHADIRGRQSNTMQECDGGAVGGDAGAASGDVGGIAVGDASGVSIDTGDTAGEIAGTSTSDVLGTYEPGKGVMGHNNFFIPSRVKHPLHRWEAAYGGSKRKKTKKGKDKKYAYEKGMKVVVDMFEEEKANSDVDSIDKRKLFSRLRRMSKGINSMDDVKSIEAKIKNDKHKIDNRLSKPDYAKAKNIFNDFYHFIKDICTGKYEASWFAVSMAAVGLVYLVSPIDLVPDAIPVVSAIDDAFVLKLIYDAIKDELVRWKALKSNDAVDTLDGKVGTRR